MEAAIKVRQDRTAEELRRAARNCADGDLVRRLPVIALDQVSRSEAAKLASVRCRSCTIGCFASTRRDLTAVQRARRWEVRDPQR